MSDFSSNAPLPSAPEEGGAFDLQSWFNTWMAALTKPNEETYTAIAQSANAKSMTGLIWMLIAGMLGAFVGGMLTFVFQMMGFSQSLPGLDSIPELERAFGSSSSDAASGIGMVLFGTLCFAPLGVLFFAIGVAITNAIARLFGGTGTYDQQLYSIAAFSAPLGLAMNVLSSIPIVGGLTAILSFYSIYLQVLSIKTVHKIGWGKAVLVILIPGLLACILAACIAFASLAVLGPIISNVFEDINQSLGQ